jgi:hypothetical protein
VRGAARQRNALQAQRPTQHTGRRHVAAVVQWCSKRVRVLMRAAQRITSLLLRRRRALRTPHRAKRMW